MWKIIRKYQNRYYRIIAWLHIYGSKIIIKIYKNKTFILIVGLSVILVFILLIKQNKTWKMMSGFFEYTTTNGEYFPGKTLWDWLELLIVPLSLAIVAYFLNRDQKEREIAIAQDESRQKTLGNYFGEISKLLLDKQLRDKNGEAKYIAQAFTLTTLMALDGSKKGLLIRFLQESKLIDRDDPTIKLEDGDLSEINLSHMTLAETSFFRANLNKANLAYAVLSNTNFEKANLCNSVLIGIKGSGVNFIGSNLESTILYSAYLANSELMGANLSKADLRGVNFSNANLRGASFRGSLLGRIRVKSANFTNTILDNADFTDSDVTYEQLSYAKSLENTLMPNGAVFDQNLHRPIK